MINLDQVKSYNDKGYLVVENAIPQDKLKELQRVTDEYVINSKDVVSNDEVYDLADDHSSSNPNLRRLKNPHLLHKVYENITRDSCILDIVEKIVGNNIRRDHTKLNFKGARGGESIEWHQDWAFYPHTNDDILEVGIPLDDMEIENGCLMAIPGSHKWEAISHHEDGVFVGAVSENDFKMEDAVPFVLKAGSISLHHVRALHGSAPNMSNRPRRLLLQGYLAADAFPLQSNLSSSEDWNEWNSNILRGEPTNRPRLENVPVVFPQPKPEGAGSIFEIQEKLKKSHYKK